MYKRSVPKAIEQFNFGHPPLSGQFVQKYPQSVLNGTKSISPFQHTAVTKSTLPNGAKAVSHDKGGLLTGVGLYVEAGSKFDPVGAPGLSYAMRWTLLTSNLEDSLFQTNAALRAHGAGFTHNDVRKRHIGLRLESRRDQWVPSFEHLCTSIAAPRFAESDIERFRDTWDNLIEEQRWQYPREYVIDQLERVTFYKEPLGNPRNMLAKYNDESCHQQMLDQYCQLYVPSNVTVVGVNVDHKDLTAAYINSPFPHSAEAPHFRDSKQLQLNHTREANQFQGGRQEHEQEKRAKVMGTKPYMEDETIVALGFATQGRDDGVEKYVAASVASQVMAIGVQDGLNYDRSETAHGVRSFYRPFGSVGMAGYTIRGTPEQVPKQIQDVIKNIPKEASAAVLESAKARATAAFYNNELETTKDYMDFLGSSTESEQQIIDAINSVSADAVNKELQSMRTSAKPTLFATGECLNLPTLRQLGF